MVEAKFVNAPDVKVGMKLDILGERVVTEILPYKGAYRNVFINVLKFPGYRGPLFMANQKNKAYMVVD